MGMMEFSYASRRGPIIPLTLSCGSNQTNSEGLLDTGAACSIIGKDLAYQLGLPHTGEWREFEGFNGSSAKAEKSIMTIILENNGEDFEAEIPIFILQNDASLLLGRDGIFSSFVATFDERQRRVFLKHN
jgi:hypothetical protein